MKYEVDLEEKTFHFSIAIIKMFLELPKNSIVTWKIGGQIIDSATSTNSNIVQARAGVSRADFINHLRIARKEARETKRWLETLLTIGFIKEDKACPLLEENEEIIKMLVSSVKNAEQNS